ncbi:hypothetical protein [Bordetella ansorpii]|nr:hypothetical protein [Bordetella ansorpii]
MNSRLRRRVAAGIDIGLRANERDDFSDAFEHGQMEATAALLRSQ